MIMPPHWYPFQPYMALPALQGYLRKQGFSTAILNLDMLSLDHFLNRNSLESYLDEAEKRAFGSWSQKLDPDEKVGRQRIFRKTSMVAPRLFDQIEDAKGILRGKGYYEYLHRAESLKVVSQAMDTLTACFYPSRYNLNGFVTRRNHNNPDQLGRITSSEAINPFLGYFRSVLRPKLSGLDPLVVGINITGDSQLVGGVTAARVVKELAPQTHVVLGGSFFSRVIEQLFKFPQVFEHADSIIAYEGEISLTELVHGVKNGASLDKVPHRCWQDESGLVRFNAGLAQPDVDTLPTPDFEGIEADLHLAPHPVMAVAASRGCYWNRCLFCDHGFCYQNRYQERSPELVVDDLEAISSTWGARYFDIVDEAVRPSHMQDISAEIQRRGLDLRWMCLGRIDKSFSPQIFKSAYDAGCRLISFGVESNSDAVLRLMNKGTSKQLNLRILDECSSAGIWTHIMIFFGFPGETAEDIQATMGLLDEHAAIFHDSGGAAFVLGRHSRVLEDLMRHGINQDEAWDASPDLAYSISLPFEFGSGQKKEDAEQAVEKFTKKSVYNKGSWDRTVSLLYRSRFDLSDYGRLIELFRTHGIRKRIADLSAMPGFKAKA